MVNIASIIDHTLLKPNATYKDFKLLCEQAVENRFCSVCVPPFMVESCKKALSNTDVKVCTVIGFPLGYNSCIGKLIEAKQAIKNGADEIDAVVNISALKSKDFSYVEKEIALLRKTSLNKVLKIIVEVRLRRLIILKTYLLCTYHITVEMFSIITQTNTKLKTNSFLPCKSEILATLSFLESSSHAGGEFCRASV